MVYYNIICIARVVYANYITKTLAENATQDHDENWVCFLSSSSTTIYKRTNTDSFYLYMRGRIRAHE